MQAAEKDGAGAVAKRRAVSFVDAADSLDDKHLRNAAHFRIPSSRGDAAVSDGADGDERVVRDAGDRENDASGGAPFPELGLAGAGDHEAEAEARRSQAAAEREASVHDERAPAHRGEVRPSAPPRCRLPCCVGSRATVHPLPLVKRADAVSQQPRRRRSVAH
jgi:hypothetical protein